MQTRASLLFALLALGMLVIPNAAAAQTTRDQPGVKNLDEYTVGVNEDLRSALKREYDQADQAIKAYLALSMQAVQEGHRLGFQQFAVWYRNYENAKKSSADAIAKEIFKQLLPVAFKMIFPEGAEFIETMAKVVEGTVAVGEKALEGTDNDINMFLEKLRTGEEQQIAKLLDTPKQFDADYHEQYAAAVLEYLDIRLQNPKLLDPTAAALRAADAARDPSMKDLPDSVKARLTNLGVPPPGSGTATKVAEGVLEYHIYEIMHNDETWRGMWPYSEHEFARAHALQQMDPAGNKARICQAERSWTFFRTIPSGECAPLLR